MNVNTNIFDLNIDVLFYLSNFCNLRSLFCTNKYFYQIGRCDKFDKYKKMNISNHCDLLFLHNYLLDIIIDRSFYRIIQVITTTNFFRTIDANYYKSKKDIIGDKLTVRSSKGLIEEDISPLNFCIFILFKYMKTEDLKYLCNYLMRCSRTNWALSLYSYRTNLNYNYNFECLIERNILNIQNNTRKDIYVSIDEDFMNFNNSPSTIYAKNIFANYGINIDKTFCELNKILYVDLNHAKEHIKQYIDENTFTGVEDFLFNQYTNKKESKQKSVVKQSKNSIYSEILFRRDYSSFSLNYIDNMLTSHKSVDKLFGMFLIKKADISFMKQFSFSIIMETIIKSKFYEIVKHKDFEQLIDETTVRITLSINFPEYFLTFILSCPRITLMKVNLFFEAEYISIMLFSKTKEEVKNIIYKFEKLTKNIKVISRFNLPNSSSEENIDDLIK